MFFNYVYCNTKECENRWECRRHARHAFLSIGMIISIETEDKYKLNKCETIKLGENKRD